MYTMVVKEKKLLQYCLYNAVLLAVTLTHQETLMGGIYITNIPTGPIQA